MQRPNLRCFAACAVFLALFSVSVPFASAQAGEITSRMRTVSGVVESNGYRIAPVYDVDVPSDYEDLTTPQAYEVLRPETGQALTIGRLFTSCSCIRLEAPKRTFEPGERVILYLRNIRATPSGGQMYAFFVQLTAPMQTTLRFDTFVQTGVRIGEERPDPSLSATPPAGDVAASLELPEPVGSGTSTPTTTGLNNQLAAALRAVNGHADTPSGDAFEGELAEVTLEGTGDILDSAAGAGDDAGETGAAEAAGEAEAPASAESAEPASGASAEPAESRESAAPASGGTPAPLSLSTDLGGDLPAFDAAPGAASANLNDDQILQLQRLALIQAEEQAKQLATRVQQLQTPPDSSPAPAAISPSPRRSPPSLADRPVQSVSLITIGCRDMPASIRFYEALGWQRAARGKYDQTAFFQLNGQVLALYPLADLLLEQNMKDAVPAPGGITLALHVQAKEDVAAVYQLFVEAGGKSLRPPAEMASGAVSSYVADPDGNPWEISWVPQFTLDPNGGLWLP